MSYFALIVEDATRQYESLAAELKTAGWEVLRAKDKQDALFRMKKLKEEQTYIDVVTVDLGLPPEPDDIHVGLELITEIRTIADYQDVPLLAYTSQSRIDYVLYANAVRRLIALRASFVYLRPLETSFAQILNLVRQGFVILSPTPASYLPNAVPNTPDPLQDELWETLATLSKGLTHLQASQEMNISPETIRPRMDRARQTLIDRGQVPVDANQDDLLAWYREHKARYARD